MIWKLLLLVTWIGIGFGFYKHVEYVSLSEKIVDEKTQELEKKDVLLKKIQSSYGVILKLKKEWETEIKKCK